MKKVEKMGNQSHTQKKFQLANQDEALEVFGPQEVHLAEIKRCLDIDYKSYGTEVEFDGPQEQVEKAVQVLSFLTDLIKEGKQVNKSDVSDGLKALEQDNTVDLKNVLKKHPIVTSKKHLYPRTIGQMRYIEAIQKNDIVFGVGPAGTGKTYLAMAMAVSKILKGEIDRIILTRPAVEAGEKLGFLPGDLAEKVNPYLKPLLDALHEMIDYERAERMIASEQIEIAPIAFMRGRTLNNSYVILDEAQNCTREQMKMFLTRLGENSSAVITGDVTQIDLPRESKSGLIQAVKILKDIDGIHIHHFDERDVVRHRLVSEVIAAYDRAQRIP